MGDTAFNARSNATAEPQPRAKAARIGLISYAPIPDGRVEHIGRELARLGYHDVSFVVRHSARDKVATARSAAELVALDLDVIWAMNTNAAVAIRHAMGDKRTPTVFWATDPVEAGIVADLRTAGSFTGFAAPIDLQLLQVRFVVAACPEQNPIPLLYHPDYGPAPSSLRRLRREAELYGRSIEVYETHELAEIEPALAAMSAAGRRLCLIGPHALFNTNGATIGSFALEHRIGLVAVQESIVRGGGLVSFFPSGRHIERGLLTLIGRILDGTPIDALPIDRKIAFTCVVNKRTAERLGLNLPEHLFSDADAIISGP